MKPARLLFSVALLAAGIALGYGYGRWYAVAPAAHLETQANPTPTGYYCPMHPNVRSNKPADCPICGMKLIPDAAPETPPPAQDHSGPPAGSFRVSPEKQQLIGVRYGEATLESGSYTFRATGRVALDETRVTKVQTRIEGWIDKVYADFTGKQVTQGQPLFTLYSPEMLASQQEYLLALRGRELLRQSPLASSHENSEALIQAARRRLELWELSRAQIDEITRTGKPLEHITIVSPASGHILTRNAFPNQRVTPDTEVYTIADLSRVWILAEIFESDAPYVEPGIPAIITLTYAGGRKLRGQVDHILPQVDPSSRTLRVRLEAANPSLLLKPDMFVDVEFHRPLPVRLTVPAEAVLDTGLRQTVFVDRGNGYLEPRTVEIGARDNGRIEIRSGLKPGERIVTSGNFLIDSESQLRSAAAGARVIEHQHD